jgi:RHS repeat-associated protein
VEYAYDDLYRLTGETRTGSHAYAITYTYDNVGNRLTQTRDGASTTYAYNTHDQLESETRATGTTQYGYDAAGRLISKTAGAGQTVYAWMDEDRMASATGPGLDVQYSYDADGRKVKEVSGTSVTQYLIDRQLPYGQVVLETDGGNQFMADYVFGLERISQSRGGESHWYAADGQGSIRQLTDSNGTETDSYLYSAFGETIATAGNTINDFRYVGEEFDANTGFYYNRARWMDPKLGRFLGVDPLAGDIFAPASLHRYLYAKSSPISFWDPSGREYTLMDLQIAMDVKGVLDNTIRSWIGNSIALGAIHIRLTKILTDRILAPACEIMDETLMIMDVPGAEDAYLKARDAYSNGIRLLEITQWYLDAVKELFKAAGGLAGTVEKMRDAVNPPFMRTWEEAKKEIDDIIDEIKDHVDDISDGIDEYKKMRDRNREAD